MGLQRQFVGLSDHIGLYEGGNVPQDLSPFLQQTFDAEDWLNPYDYLRNTAALTAQGQAIVQTVPEGELWRVRSIHLEWLNASGPSRFQGVVNPDGIGLVGLEKSDTTLTFGAGVRAYTGLFFPNPIVLKGSQQAQIGFQLEIFAIGTTNVDLVVHRQKINI